MLHPTMALERDDVSHRWKNEQCELTGWIGRCDRHRHEPSKGYTKENTVILSPNEHRDLHDILEVFERELDTSLDEFYDFE
jgi:hypothetical protein